MRYFTSESVTPGHPDKICDQISDSILDAYLREDPAAHVAVEVFASAAGITIGGEVSSTASVDRAATARRVLRKIGYTDASGVDPDGIEIIDQVTTQSAEIADGVGVSLEQRDGVVFDDFDRQGAGDQGIMFGFATAETPDLMPLPITLAHRLAQNLTEARTSGAFPFLRPDGKTQVTVGYGDSGAPSIVDTILLSTQHDPDVSHDAIETALADLVVMPVLKYAAKLGVRVDGTRIIVNPSGSFVLGGPAADTGLTGRKIIVDTYGGAARHGGGAFSGKDPSKVDRSGAYATRWIAKNVVAARLALRCEVQVAYAIGQAAPVGVYVETFGTNTVPQRAIEQAIRQVFDLRPAAMIAELGLLAPLYADTAVFGHFGGWERPWERTTKAGALQAAVARLTPAREAPTLV